MSQTVKIEDLPTTWNARLRQARKNKGWSVPQLARAIVGDDDQQVDAIRERIYSYEKARKPVDQPRGTMMADLARALDVTVEWLRDGVINDPSILDRSVIASDESGNIDLPQGNAEWVNEPISRRPVRRWIFELGRAAGGREGMFTLSNSDVVDRDLCPPEVVNSKDPYLVRVVGDSMVPRFKERERLVIDPDEPYAKGDDVVVQLRTDDANVFESYVKEFVSLSSKELTLKQHNPPKGSDTIMRFPKSRVHRIHKVVGVQMKVKHKT